MATKTKVTTKQAIQKVLAKSDGPMKVTDIIKQGIPLATNVKSKTPGQVFYSVLYAEAKKSDGIFEQVGRGEFKLSGKVNADAAPEPVESLSDVPNAVVLRDGNSAKPDPKPKRKSRAKAKK